MAAATPVDRPPPWVADAVFYQIFPDRFARSAAAVRSATLEAWEAPPTVHGYKGGDLTGIQDHLDHLQALGIDAIYLNPIFQSASNHRYHTHDYYRVDPLLGGDPAFDRLLAACHERGIRVVLDGVFNHASRGFFQFNDLLENGPHSPWAGWWIVHEWPLKAYEDNANYEAWWGIPALPKFNTENPDVREYLMRVGEHWTRRGIDGWRLDVPLEISTPGFWEEFRQRTRAINPDLYIVAEIWHDAAEWVNDGRRFDGTMNYLFTGYAVQFVVGPRVAVEHTVGLSYAATPPIDAGGFADRVAGLHATYPGPARRAHLNLLDSHDTARLITLAGGDRDSLVLATLLQMTFPGAPCVYYGDEIGLAGGKDPDNRRAMPWDADRDDDLLASFRSLIALRRSHPALRSADYEAVWPPPAERGRMLFAALRRHPDGDLLVAVNAGEAAEVATPSRADLGAGALERLWGEGAAEAVAGDLHISVPPRRGAVWRLR